MNINLHKEVSIIYVKIILYIPFFISLILLIYKTYDIVFNNSYVLSDNYGFKGSIVNTIQYSTPYTSTHDDGVLLSHGIIFCAFLSFFIIILFIENKFK